MRFEVKNPLSEQQWQSIEEAALRILAKTGLKVTHAEILDLLSRKKGVSIDGAIVRLEPTVVLDLAKTVKGTSDYDARVMAGAYCHNYMPADSMEFRPSTLADLVRSVKEADAL